MLIRGFQYGGGGGGAGSNGPANAIQTSDGAGGFVGESEFSYDPVTNTVSLASGVQTANNPAFNISQTWNNAAVTFTGLRFNVTNTASASGSKFVEFVSGAHPWINGGYFSIDRDAKITMRNAVNSIYTISLNSLLTFGGGANFYGSVYTNTQFVADIYAFGYGATDTYVVKEATSIIAQRNSTNAQTFRVYNTYTDASNYERGFMRWSSNVLEIGSEAAGSGTNRQLTLSAGNGQFSFKSGTGSEGNGCAGRLSYGFTVGAWNPNGSSGGRDVRLNLSGSSVCIDTGIAATAPFTEVNGTQYFFTSSSACFRQGANMTIGAWTRGSDAAVGNATYTANTAFASAATNIVGGAVNVVGGAGASDSAGAANGGHVYLDGGQGYGTGNHGNIIVGNTRGKLQLTPTTVAGLGSASPAGQRTFVTDANSTTFHSIVAAGGTNFVPVFSDGTNWRIG